MLQFISIMASPLVTTAAVQTTMCQLLPLYNTTMGSTEQNENKFQKIFCQSLKLFYRIFISSYIYQWCRVNRDQLRSRSIWGLFLIAICLGLIMFPVRYHITQFLSEEDALGIASVVSSILLFSGLGSLPWKRFAIETSKNVESCSETVHVL